MNYLINQNQLTKVSLPLSRLISSLPVIEKSTVSISKHEQDVTAFDPFHFFTHLTKTKHYTIKNAKIMHTHLLKSDLLQSNIFYKNSLLDWYCKSSSIVNALKLFDTIPPLNVISWNIMISGYSNVFSFEDSLRFFCRMLLLGFEPDEITYGSVLSACTGMQASMFGMQVYSLTMKNGFFSSGFVRAGLIDLLAKTFSFDDALRVFCDVSCENVVCWNAIISGAVRSGEYWVALDMFRQMCHRSLQQSSFTFSSVLSACTTLGDLETGKAVQGRVIKCGVNDVFLGTAIVDLYAKCGDMDEAEKEFSCMPIRNVVSWTAIISGFVQKGDYLSALNFFKEMRKETVEINKYTITSVLTACAKSYLIEEGEKVHSWIIISGFYLDPVVASALINMYAKIGSISLAEKVFREMEDIVSLSTQTVMISSFVQNQSFQKAIELLQRMLRGGLKPDKFCISCLLSGIDSLELGRQIHCSALKAALIYDLSVGCSLLTMYSKCGSLEESYKVFGQIPFRDNALWASMIAGFVEHGFACLAFQLFREMLFEETIPDRMTLAAILKACFAIPSLDKGKEVHGYALRAGIDKDTLIGGALVTMYAKCSALNLARRVFDILPLKDQVSCSSLISGYAQNGLVEEAVLFFHEMLMADLEIDSFVLSSVLRAICLLNRLGLGTQLHGLIMKIGLEFEISVGSALVTMYSKCGSVEDCCKAFEQIDEPDLIAWTALITSYAQNGKGAEALRVYELMKNEGNRPDSVTFVAVLSACSHNGLVEEGYFHFNSMAIYGIEPNNCHYACMVDLLGRSGRLKEAEKFIENMPIEPDALVWGTLLAACKVHGDIEIGRLAAEKVIKLDPYDAGAYVSLSNICADVGHWEEVLEVRSQMRGTGIEKKPGWSFM